MSTLLIVLMLVPLVLALPALTLKGACAVAGPKVPSFGSALGMALLNALATAIAGALLGATFGLIIGVFSVKLAALVTSLLTLLFSGFLYSGMLRCRWSQGVAVAFVHGLLNSAVFAAAYAVWHLLA